MIGNNRQRMAGSQPQRLDRAGRKADGGESVSQSPLKDKAFSTFLDQNPPFELLAEMGFAPDKSLFSR